MPRMTTGFPRSDAADDFDRMRRGQRVSRVGQRLRRKRSVLPSLESVAGPTARVDGVRRGRRTVELDRVVGTAEPTDQFDAEFRPTSARTRRRWEDIARALRQGTELPPITAFEFGGDYFVRDGRHRVSVAKALGRPTIDADVTEVRSG